MKSTKHIITLYPAFAHTEALKVYQCEQCGDLIKAATVKEARVKHDQEDSVQDQLNRYLGDIFSSSRGLS